MENLRLMLTLAILAQMIIAVWSRALHMGLDDKGTATVSSTSTDLITDSDGDDDKIMKDVLFIVGMTVLALVIVAFIAVIVYLRWRANRRFEMEIEKMQQDLDKKQERERLQYQEKLTDKTQNHRRAVIASSQRRLISAIESANLDTELLEAVNADGNVKDREIVPYFQKLCQANKEADQRAHTIRILADITKLDAENPGDLVEVNHETCLHPEIKVRKTNQVVTVAKKGGKEETRRFNINSLVVLTKAKAFIGQLPPDEIDLFDIVIREMIGIIVVDETLMNTYIWKNYVDIDKTKSVTVGQNRVLCLQHVKMPRSGFVGRKMVIWYGSKSHEFRIVFINQLPDAHNPKAVLEMEDACAHMEAASFELADDASKVNLLFLDSTGTANAVSLCVLYICRQQLMRCQAVNLPAVMKRISRSRYGCWANVSTQDVVNALILIYQTLAMSGLAMAKGDKWHSQKKKKEQKQKGIEAAQQGSNKAKDVFSSQISGSEAADGSLTFKVSSLKAPSPTGTSGMKKAAAVPSPPAGGKIAKK